MRLSTTAATRDQPASVGVTSSFASVGERTALMLHVNIDEPTTLPDGHEVELCVLNDDGMSEDERDRLHASIARGIRDGRAGREMDLDSYMDQLDAEP